MIRIFADQKELARGAAEFFVARRPRTVALSGGSTPKAMFELLATETRVSWADIHFFWSDERHVPPDHPESNYRMANEALLSHVHGNVHRVPSENPDAAAAAREYEKTIIEVTKQTLPRLDLIFLGLGTDGHTASIFPGSEVLHEMKHLVAAPYVEKLKTYRITMTLPLLNNGASVVFLVSGAEKAEIVKEVLEGETKYPAQAVKPTQGELIWMLDQPAAARLTTLQTP
ncbi:MAG TPA: 6-phosphogluconolactonase [Pyrinomonadaceae bacterium]|nr:6-phosphogluconolactonase [Pyrinomonadaceae bacterium]